MKPSEPMVFAALIRTIDDLEQNEKDPVKRTSYLAMKFILETLERDWDDLAAMRFEEINDLSSLLVRGAGIVPEKMGADLSEIAMHSSRAKELPKLSNLDKAIDALRYALTDLQTWLEAQTTPEAQTLLRDTLSFLHASAKRRASVDYLYRY